MPEIRACTARAERTGGALTLRGAPVVYGEPAEITGPGGSYTETILPGALDETDLSDIRLLYNHDLNKVPLARSPKTMDIIKSGAGLEIIAHLPDTEGALAIYKAVQRGDLTGMSFAFDIPPGGDEWGGGSRTIKKIGKIYEVSITPFPAYPQTKVEARGGAETKGGNGMEFETVQDAFNFYRAQPLDKIEKRAGELEKEKETGSQKNFSIEFKGLMEAKTNLLEKLETQEARAQNLKPIGSMDFSGAAAPGDILASREYRSAFCKTMLNQPLDSTEASVFQSANKILAADKRAAFINTSEHAAAIPTQMLEEIFKKASELGGVLALCRRFDIPANLAVPVATPEDAAQWHIEGAEMEASSAAPTNVIFNGHELMKVFSISAAARGMSISAYEKYLQEELSRVMLTALQQAAVNGTGNGQPVGVLPGVTWSAANSITGAAPEFGAFLKTAALLKSGYSPGAAWAMNNATLYNVAMSVMDLAGKPMLYEARDGGADRILGKPVVIDGFIPDNVVLFGDFSYYGVNYPQNILLEASRDSSFRKGLIDYRAMAVADGKPIIGEAFVKTVFEL